MTLVTSKQQPTDVAVAPRPLTQRESPPAVVTSRAPDPRAMRWVNPFMCALLRSPLHRVLSSKTLLLTYTGRKSGRRYTLPVGYTRDGDALLVISQHADQQRWWRNLRDRRPVVLQLRGHPMTARADVIDEPMAVAAEVERLIARFGRKQASARLYLGLDTTPTLTRDQLAQALAGVVLIRLVPDDRGEAGPTDLRQVPH